MVQIKIKLFIGLILITVLTAAILSFQPKIQPPLPTPLPIPKPQVMAFFVNGRGAGDSFPSLQTHYQFLDIISPFWYSIRDNGHVSTDSRHEVSQFARQSGLKTIPLVTNSTGTSSQFLINSAAREQSLTELVKIAREYDGLNLDIEYISPKYREPLTQYVQQLSSLLIRERKKLYFCVFPQLDFPEKLWRLHDYQGLADVCDGIILMAYDQHRPNTSAGPVASIGWVEDNIRHALKSIPLKKLWLGIPVYGYKWRTGPSGKGIALSAREAEENAARLNIEPQWDPNAKVPYYSYTGDTLSTPQSRFTVWYEDKKSATFKYELVKKYGLPGIAFWRLDYEVEDFWEVFQD